MGKQKEIFRQIVESLLQRGADYAEVFYQHAFKESLSSVDNKRFVPSFAEIEGYSIRVFVGEAVYFEATSDGSEANLIKIASNMLGKKLNRKKFDFQLVDEFEGDWHQNIDLARSKKLLTATVKKTLAYKQKITNASASIGTSSDFRVIATSAGKYVEFPTYHSNFSFSAVAKEKEEQQTSGGKFGKAMNNKDFFHFLNTQDIDKSISHAAQIANELLVAPAIKGGEMTVILPNAFGGVLFHEAVGHPLEASSIAKNLSTYAGKKNQKVASELVTLIDDGTMLGEWGTAKYDDEGEKPQRRVLIEKGVLKKFLVDRYNGLLMKEDPNGSSRREDFTMIPTSRMSNTFIANGESEVSDIIKKTKNGFYAKNLGGGQVDPFTGQFNFGVTEGYLIKDGKIAHLVKPAALIGNGMEILMRVDMVGNDFKIETGTCGAASGYIPVTVGQPTLRISKMTVGGA